MQTIETLPGLERRLDLNVSAADLEKEVALRLNRLARTVRMPGFRPGKVPLKMVAASYGAQVQAEVLNDKVGAAFNSAVTANNLRVAGTPRVDPKTDATGDPRADLSFSATFEVYPEVRVGDVQSASVQRATCVVGEGEIDKTLAIMRKQRATFALAERAAADGDRVTVDFAGTIDGVAFPGGSSADFEIALGEGRMLPEFEAAMRGMRAGDENNFPLTFPADYRATELAGKQAQFNLKVRKVEQSVLPPVDADFARSLGVADGDPARMRAEIRANLEREVATRLKSRTKESVMDALLTTARFDVPKTMVAQEQERLAERARTDLQARGVAMKDMPLPLDVFAASAERRVRLGLLLAELVRVEKLQPQQQQIRKALDNIAQTYEKPAEVIQYYLGNRERLAEIETVVAEDNVVDWVLSRAQVADAPVPFDELMGRSGAAAAQA